MAYTGLGATAMVFVGTGIAVDFTGSHSVSGTITALVSSRRFKENIQDIQDILDVLKLRPVNFNYINDKTKSKAVGLIAEEVHDIIPALVVYDSDGLPFTVRYNDLPILLLNEIKKLVKRIEVLERKVT